MNQPLVSIIIPTYHGARYIAQTVDSALTQTYSHREVIVVDDGSPDDTALVLKPYEGRIRYIRKTNGGPASARNAGIVQAQGEYLAFLDGDDLWEKDKLAEQVAFLMNHPECGLVYTNLSIIDEKDIVISTTDRTRPSGNLFMSLFMKNSIPTSSVLVRKACFEKVGVFDEDRDLISVEDYDMWIRIASQFQIGFLNKPLLRYRIHRKGISRNIARSYLGEEKVIRKNADLFRFHYPKILPLLKQRLAQLYFEFGYEYFHEHDYLKAREQLKISLNHRPQQLKGWVYYGLTFLRPENLRILRQKKQQLSRGA
jgi:glycosyltransferase involved in cell wall biosynthesis